MCPARSSRKSSGTGDPAPRFFHRDTSWLEFNRRVLAQAGDAATPLLDRVRFLAIFTSNLDEFFMKRVGLIKRQVYAGLDVRSPDGLSPRQQLAAIREMVAELVAEQTRLFEADIRPALRKEGVEVVNFADLTVAEKDATTEWYIDNVFPALTPLAVNPTHRFPFISNLSDNLGLLVDVPEGARGAGEPSPRAQSLLQPVLGTDAPGPEPTFARVKIPATMPHYYRLPSGDKKVFRFVPLQQIVGHNLSGLFPGMRISEQISFRVTRSAGIQKDDLDTANLLQSIEADIKQRRFARVVRVELDESASPPLRRWLLDKLNVDQHDVYERPASADFNALSELAELDRLRALIEHQANGLLHAFRKADGSFSTISIR